MRDETLAILQRVVLFVLLLFATWFFHNQAQERIRVLSSRNTTAFTNSLDHQMKRAQDIEDKLNALDAKAEQILERLKEKP